MARQTITGIPRAKAFLEATVRVYDAPHGRDFAFGMTVIDKRPTKVFISLRSKATKVIDDWKKIDEPGMPSVGDVLDARICTDVQGRNYPFAVYWQKSSVAKL